MKEETARELYERIKKSCELLSKATNTKATPDDVIRRGFQLYPFFPLPTSRDVPSRLKNAAARGGFLELLRAMPEPNEGDKEKYLTALGDLPFLLRRAFAEAGRTLPHKPGGAPSAFESPQKKREACEDVGRLLSMGEEKPAAFSQVARKYKVSQRTMRRAWSEYCSRRKQN